ncbi:hypothetical protein MYA_1939 [Burkholderia sp. KJ006]|nr:hypothetical protein MYA_1939 [Burkholderia sp. KJ006]
MGVDAALAPPRPDARHGERPRPVVAACVEMAQCCPRSTGRAGRAFYNDSSSTT